MRETRPQDDRARVVVPQHVDNAGVSPFEATFRTMIVDVVRVELEIGRASCRERVFKDV